MSPKFLIDVNLGFTWVQKLTDAGWEAAHWYTIGSTNATDIEIMEWAERNNYVVFTSDLDFGKLLALEKRFKPSVVLIRFEDTRPQQVAWKVTSLIKRFEQDLITGCILVIDESKQRMRILPLN